MRAIISILFFSLVGCPAAEPGNGAQDRSDCQENCALCLSGDVRADCDDACLDLTEEAARSFNRCVGLTTCEGVPECARTHLSVDVGDLSNVTNNINNPTNNSSNATNNAGTNNRPCLSACFDNTDCDSSARCEYPEGMQACCKRGTRGTVEIGQFCADENDCVSGFCEAAKCAQYCEFTADCDAQFRCEGMRCVPGEMICDDMEDNDLNGATDCEDEACDGQPCDQSGRLCDLASATCI